MTGYNNTDVYRPLSADDLKHVAVIDKDLDRARQQLGELRAAYLEHEQALAAKINQMHAQREMVLTVFSQTYLKDLDGQWVYDASAQGFVKQQHTGAKHNGTSHDLEQPVEQ